MNPNIINKTSFLATMILRSSEVAIMTEDNAVDGNLDKEVRLNINVPVYWLHFFYSFTRLFFIA